MPAIAATAPADTAALFGPAAAEDILARFVRYCRVDTTAREETGSYPSSPGQWDLARMLAGELTALGAADVRVSDKAIVTALLPANVPHAAPGIAFFAHMDTSPETTGKDVRPQVHRRYAGGDIVLPGDPTKVVRAADNPALAGLIGSTIVTTDGTTLLGADNKAGIAAIMGMVAALQAAPRIPRGPVTVCFTCDEEIGHGVDHVPPEVLRLAAGYTLDGEGRGIIDAETFSADLAVLTVTGVNIHPSIGKGRMVNAVRIASAFVDRLPRRTLAPETTDGRQGFVHPYRIEGGVASVSVRMLLRDFDTARLREHEAVLRATAAGLQAEHPDARIDLVVTPQYRNMADGLAKEPRALRFAEDAMRAAGQHPHLSIVRGGTDGSRLTELGLPTPNLSTGEHNPHSPLEWTCLEEIVDAARVCVEVVRLWSAERV